MMFDKDAIWSALPMPTLVLKGDNAIARVNPAAESFLSRSRRSLRDKPLSQVVQIPILNEAMLARVRANQSPMVFNDLDVQVPDRAKVKCHVQVTPLGEDDDTLLLLISPREIAGKLDRAQSSKSAAKSAIGMAEMLAHEIKNPLAGITGAAQLLSMNLPAEDMELTDLIVTECQRIVKLLEQVEQFGNLRPPERKPVNLHDLLDRARKSAELGFAADKRFISEYDPSLPATMADGDQMLQVFLNLIKNAAEAMTRSGEGSTIRIRTFYDRSLRRLIANGETIPVPLQIEIIDDGPGLPPEIAADIFEPFVSGRENGTGLGLALVSKIVSENDGLIATESAPGHTVFRISLPLAPRAKPLSKSKISEDS